MPHSPIDNEWRQAWPCPPQQGDIGSTPTATQRRLLVADGLEKLSPAFRSEKAQIGPDHEVEAGSVTSGSRLEQADAQGNHSDRQQDRGQIDQVDQPVGPRRL